VCGSVLSVSLVCVGGMVDFCELREVLWLPVSMVDGSLPFCGGRGNLPPPIELSALPKAHTYY
jgi:hypothetical protein